jgi:hypothetical protein
MLLGSCGFDPFTELVLAGQCADRHIISIQINFLTPGVIARS